MLPALVITQFINEHNAGFAGAMAGWAAALASMQIRAALGHGTLEERAGGSAMESLVQREFAVLLAVPFAYIAFKATGFDPIFLSLTVGVLSSLAATFASSLAST